MLIKNLCSPRPIQNFIYFEGRVRSYTPIQVMNKTENLCGLDLALGRWLVVEAVLGF